MQAAKQHRHETEVLTDFMVGVGDPVRAADRWYRAHPGFRGRLSLRWEPIVGPGWIAVFEWVGERVRWVSCSPAALSRGHH